MIIMLGASASLMAARQKVKMSEPAVATSAAGGQEIHIKLKKEFVGAQVTVMDVYNQELGSTTIPGRRISINFIELLPGTYKLRIEKDNRVYEVQYVKTSLGLFEL